MAYCLVTWLSGNLCQTYVSFKAAKLVNRKMLYKAQFLRRHVSINIADTDGGSPGLMLMGGDSCSKGCEFKSWHNILDGHFLHTYIFVVKFVMCVWKDENKWKRGRVSPFFITGRMSWMYTNELLFTALSLCYGSSDITVVTVPM